MRDKLKKIVAYIFRSWDNDLDYTHPLLKILPPFFYELIIYFLLIAILYKLTLYLWSII